MDVTDEHGTRIGQVHSITETGEVSLRLDDGKSLTAILSPRPGIIVLPSSEHHPHCRPECEGGTHYLTSDDG